MKKLLMALFIAILLAACNGSKLEINVSNSSYNNDNGDAVFELAFLNDGKPVKVNEPSMQLEMEEMDHGTIVVDFQEVESGQYEGNATLPMKGKWLATIEYEYQGKSYSELKEITIQ